MREGEDYKTWLWVACSGVPTGGGVWGVEPPPPPEIPKFCKSRTGLQTERKMFSVPIPTS